MNSFRESQMLGEVARRLDRLDPGAKERLCSAGVKVGSFRDLASLLRQLASIRNRAAHDDGQRMPRLTKRDAAEAQSFTIQILQRLHALRR